MMTDEEFIAELRAWTNSPFDDDAHEAADRIEQLIKDREHLTLQIEQLIRDGDFWIGTAKTAIWTDSEELDFLYDQNKKLEDALRWYSEDISSQGDVARSVLKELEDNNDH